MAGAQQETINTEVWRRGHWVDQYATRRLRPVETTFLERYRGALSGRVLELGCGAGRLLGYLCEASESVFGIDISLEMIAYCHQHYPRAHVHRQDFRDLAGFQEGCFTAVIAGTNNLDVLADGERRRVLSEVRRILSPDGLLIFSSHNRDYVEPLRTTAARLVGVERSLLHGIGNMPHRIGNYRRMHRFERNEQEYAIRNDSALDFALLHYYISLDAQRRQLEQEGYELIECIDLDGGSVASAAAATHCPELHYIARCRASALAA